MAEEANFGVARLRQAIANQATCCRQFELAIVIECDSTMAMDVLRRAKALAELDVKETGRG